MFTLQMPNKTIFHIGDRYTLILTQRERNVSSDMCAERRHKSACASTQSEQNLRYPPDDALDPLLSTECAPKTDQTIRVRRVIWVLARPTYNLTGNAVSRLMWLRKLTGFVCLVWQTGTRHRYLWNVWSSRLYFSWASVWLSAERFRLCDLDEVTRNTQIMVRLNTQCTQL